MMAGSSPTPESSLPTTRDKDRKAGETARARLHARISEAMPAAAQSAHQQQPPPSIPDHELVRRIGSGSYGHVWLARSVTGTYRAVKVVYRSSFDSERPFEREFAGIRRFEPISRSHESQVNVLHVGRNDAEGYFYYVMELADPVIRSQYPVISNECSVIRNGPEDTRQRSTHSLLTDLQVTDSLITDYSPRTLRSELERHERLPFEACLEIALALTTSLEHLHKHGLIHRDIKPSNIIFVNGRPKLADIGLVTKADATCSFVGTEGYLPPEGPGAAPADLYSLGKVLYEIATGKDRRDFPALPEPRSSPDEERRFLELNAIILKACQRDSRERYESAEQIHADLLLLQAGKSVRRTHQLEQRLAVASRVGAVFLAVSVVATSAYFWASYQRRLTNENLVRAEKSEIALRDQLRESLLHQARALRLSGRPGQRSEALAALGKAATIRAGLDVRSEAVHCLSLMELRPLRRWAKEGSLFAVNLHHEKVVESDLRGNLVIRSIPDDTEFMRLPGPGARSWNTSFSPDGRYLSTKYHHAESHAENQLKIWDLSQKDARIVLPGGIQPMAFDFSPDSRFAASGTMEGDLVIHELNSGREVLRYALGFDPYALSYSPEGTRLAISNLKGPVQIRAVKDGALLKTFEHPAGSRGLAWHPDGQRLVVSCDDWLIYLWDVETERRLGIFVGHKAQVVNAKFSHHGKWLASVGWDRTVGLWDVERIQLLVASPVLSGTRFLEFSPDDARLACYGDEPEILEITAPTKVFQATGLREPSLMLQDFSLDGELAAHTTLRGLSLRTMSSPAQSTNWLHGPMRAVRFLPDDRLIVGGERGLFLTRIQRPSASNDTLGFSPPVPLWTNRFYEGPNDFALTRDYRALVVRADTDAAAVLDLTGERPPLLLRPHPRLTYVALSPDGRWAATASGSDRDVRIWDATKGVLLKQLAGAGPARIAFSPRDSRLVITTRDGCSILHGGTWELLHRIPRLLPGRQVRPQRAILSADGELMAVSWPADLVRLIHLPSGEALMDLKALGQNPLCFSPDGARLYVLGQYAEVYFWDLNGIRSHLARIALDWKTARRDGG